MQPGAYYRTTDHVNNFKMKIRLWKASSNLPLVTSFTPNIENVTAKQTKTPIHDMDEHVFSWQEKIFSQKELDYYEVERDYQIPIEKKYHEDVLKIKKNVAAYPKYLFSYVEADTNRPTPTFVKPTTSDFIHPVLAQRETLSSQLKGHPGHPSYNASRVRPFGDGEFGGTLRHRGRVVEFLPSDDFKSRRSQVLGSFQTMYIMANVRAKKHETTQPQDPSVEQASATQENKENKENKGNDNNESSSEVMLCMIRYDPSSGLLIMKPDFNPNRTPYEVTATTHTESFNYKIMHCSQQMTAQDLERDRQTLSLIDAQRANLLRASVGPDFEIPFRDVFRLIAFGEILSATDFEYDSLYVVHSWDMPSMWSLAPRCSSGGVTQRCMRTLVDDHYVAYFSSPVELDAFYHCSPDNAENVMRLPSLLIHVSSIDSWNRLRTEGYGFLDVPVQPGVHEVDVHCWRPVGRSMFDELRRFFIGATPEIEDLTYARVPSSFQGNRLSKLGFRVMSTGTVKIRLNVMHQAGEAGGASAELVHQLTGRLQTGFIPDSQLAARLTQRGGLAGMSALSIAVQNVLDGYQKAKEKLAAAREGLPAHLRALLMLSASEKKPAQPQAGFPSAASAVLSSRMAATNRLNAERSARSKKE